MSQFELHLLNFKKVLIYIFCVTYLYYIKELCVFFFYIFKLPNWLNVYFLWIFLKKKLYLNNLFKQVLNILFLDFKQMKLLFSILKVENNNFFYYNYNK